MRFSIIINNYNYAQFVREAINSALAVSWPDTEVLVIDDGSTDGSWSAIQSYGGRIKAMRVDNQGQNACLNTVFPFTTGDIVMVLDSDDALEPHALDRIAAAWTPDTVKVQFALQFFDVTMTRKGQVWPVYDARHTPDYMLRTLRRTGTCPYTVTTGNAWSRGFLGAMLPLPAHPELRSGFDQLLSRVAPFLGTVQSLPEPLARYRVHDKNVSQIGTFSEGMFQRAVERERVYERELAALYARAGLPPPVENRSETMVMAQVACKALVGGERYGFGGWPALLRRYWAAVAGSENGWKRKTEMVAWSLAVAALPRPLALRACALRQRGNRRFAVP